MKFSELLEDNMRSLRHDELSGTRNIKQRPDSYPTGLTSGIKWFSRCPSTFWFYDCKTKSKFLNHIIPAFSLVFHSLLNCILFFIDNNYKNKVCSQFLLKLWFIHAIIHNFLLRRCHSSLSSNFFIIPSPTLLILPLLY